MYVFLEKLNAARVGYPKYGKKSSYTPQVFGKAYHPGEGEQKQMSTAPSCITVSIHPHL